MEDFSMQIEDNEQKEQIKEKTSMRLEDQKRLQQKFRKNVNNYSGMIVRQSDMKQSLRADIARVIKVNKEIGTRGQVMCQKITQYLNREYQNGWMCFIGKNFTANINHQPKFFLRLSDENCHFLIYKMENNKRQLQVSPDNKNKQ